jgi:hypothetical protein
MLKKTWRNDPGLIFECEYEKKFAWIPVKCENDVKIWWKPYYIHYVNWGHTYNAANSQDSTLMAAYHQDCMGNITEEEYIVRKLADTL